MNARLFSLSILLGMLSVSLSVAAQGTFDDWFDGRTLRIDCLRKGCADGDTVWVAHQSDRGSRWHGSHTQLIDPFDNGEYRVTMTDAATGQVLYSRGYNTLFGEYKSTPEGRHTTRQFEETLLLPMPRKAVHIVLQKRDTTLLLVDATVAFFSPQELEDGRKEMPQQAVVLQQGGNPETKFDLVFVMQGYGAVCGEKLRDDMERMCHALFVHEPFASHRTDFNVYAVASDVGATYGTYGAERYLMTFDLWKLHDAIGTTPCDAIVIVVNDSTYGGGAIYNFYAVTSLHPQVDHILPHELGHSIGGLADEYVDEELSYGDMHSRSHEPLEPNITNMTAFSSKWLYLLPAGTPIPTPADPKVTRQECGPLGVYEGAGYASHGVYRPAQHCMMRDYAPFCPVCRKRLEAIFGLYTR